MAVGVNVPMGVVMAVVVGMGTGHQETLYYNISGVYKRKRRPQQGDWQCDEHRHCVTPLPPRSGGEGSGVGGASADSLPEERTELAEQI